MIKKFDEFINENFPTEISPQLKKSLDELGKGFENDKEIFDAIIMTGFENAKTGKETSADYVFIDPETDDEKKYISYRSGYVRAIWLSKSYWSKETVRRMTPITKSTLTTPRERLLFILRRAMKVKNLFDSWKKSGKTAKEFLHNKRGSLGGKKYGI
jgi:hypothetical protein